MLHLHLLQRLLMPFVLGSSRLSLVIFKVRLHRLHLRLDAEVVLIMFAVYLIDCSSDRLGLHVFSLAYIFYEPVDAIVLGDV